MRPHRRWGNRYLDTHVIALSVATFLVTLVAGFLVAFALIAMPRLAQLTDREFIRAFQFMDGIIQRGQPLFMVMWVGSVVALVGAAALAFGPLDSGLRALLGVAVAVYVVGVQVPTAAINIPLNNRIQAVDTAALDADGLRAARDAFEPSWNRWNVNRAVAACVAAALLIGLVALA